jgi:hypothetical protein
MTTAIYTETVLPELAYLVAQQADPALLNAAADFSSYFERDEVLRFGGDMHAVRRSADENGEVEPSDPVSATASLIACSSTAFTVKSSAIPELVAMYFVSSSGVAEVTLLSGRSVVAMHPPQIAVDSLLLRHVANSSGMALVVRRRRDGSRRHLAISGGVSAFSDDGLTWRQGDASQDATEALRRFITE